MPRLVLAPRLVESAYAAGVAAGGHVVAAHGRGHGGAVGGGIGSQTVEGTCSAPGPGAAHGRELFDPLPAYALQGGALSRLAFW